MSKGTLAGVLCVLVCGHALAQTTRPMDGNSAKPSPDAVSKRALGLLAAGKQAEAEDLLERAVSDYQMDQRVVFLTACLRRSRFMVKDAFPFFGVVVELDQSTTIGKAARLIQLADANRDREKAFSDLRALADGEPNDPILRWMVAVQCRAMGKNEEGVKQYQMLLKLWDPGPILVHQTYGNLLDELKRYEEALVERKKTAALSPQPYAFQGLGNTLTSLRRFEEANTAYAQCVALAPDDSRYWRSWARGLIEAGKVDDAIPKAKKSVELDPKNWLAWSDWGMCLEKKGQPEEALAKYRKALEANPSDSLSKSRIQALESRSRKPGT